MTLEAHPSHEVAVFLRKRPRIARPSMTPESTRLPHARHPSTGRLDPALRHPSTPTLDQLGRALQRGDQLQGRLQDGAATGLDAVRPGSHGHGPLDDDALSRPTGWSGRASPELGTGRNGPASPASAGDLWGSGLADAFSNPRGTPHHDRSAGDSRLMATQKEQLAEAGFRSLDEALAEQRRQIAERNAGYTSMAQVQEDIWRQTVGDEDYEKTKDMTEEERQGWAQQKAEAMGAKPAGEGGVLAAAWRSVVAAVESLVGMITGSSSDETTAPSAGSADQTPTPEGGVPQMSEADALELQQKLENLDQSLVQPSEDSRPDRPREGLSGERVLDPWILTDDAGETGLGLPLQTGKIEDRIETLVNPGAGNELTGPSGGLVSPTPDPIGGGPEPDL